MAERLPDGDKTKVGEVLGTYPPQRKDRRGMFKKIRLVFEADAARTLIQRAPTQEDRARLLDIQSRSAAAFLRAMPTSFPFRMTPEVLVSNVRFRLGLFPLRDHESRHCPRHLDKVLDQNALHVNACPTGARIFRHDMVRNAFATVARRAGHSVLLEDRQCRESGGKSFGPDVAYTSASSTTWTDISVVHVLQRSYIKSSASGAGTALDARAKAKASKYKDACAQLKVSFAPLVISAYGRLHKEFAEGISRLARDSPGDTGVAQRLAVVLLAVALARGNAAMFRAASRSSPSNTHHVDVSVAAIGDDAAWDSPDLENAGSPT